MSDVPRPELSVVVSTLGNYAVLQRVLDGYSRQDAPPGSFELIVVADRADPQPEEIDAAIGTRPYPVRRIRGAVPGLSANRNAGWDAAAAPVVLFTDNDTIPVRRLVSEHLEWHRREPAEEVAVIGHVRWARELRVTAFMRWLERGIQFDFGTVNGTEAGWGHLYGANASIKRGLLERVGGFDAQRLPYGYEDLEWAYRASKVGLRVLYNRRAVVDHLRRDMTLAFWQRRMRRVAAAERRFVQMHPEIEPWFHRMFTAAGGEPATRGRGARLAPFVPPWVPWLGPKTWAAADRHWKQALAPYFLEAWEAAAADTGEGGPDLSELASPRPG